MKQYAHILRWVVDGRRIQYNGRPVNHAWVLLRISEALTFGSNSGAEPWLFTLVHAPYTDNLYEGQRYWYIDGGQVRQSSWLNDMIDNALHASGNVYLDEAVARAAADEIEKGKS